jgi:hypothetical protein
MNKQDIFTEYENLISSFLLPKNRIQKGVSEAAAIRDYLIWLMVCEFGLRISEVLGLRLSDFQLWGPDPIIRVVSLADRGHNYIDPRSPNDPKVMSRSRELGLRPHLKIHNLIDTYIFRFRVKSVIHKGQPFLTPILPHPYFFISHIGNNLEPLSVSEAHEIASQIEFGTGIPFSWNYARYAFFDRLLTADIRYHYNELIDDLVYVGGWRDEKTFVRYIRRVRRLTE